MFDRHKDAIIRLLLWILMLLMLLASMRHVAWLFATIEGMNRASGWLGAVGFDFGVFLLTLIAHKHREGSAQRRFIRAGIYVNAVLSAIANVMYGVEHQVELVRVGGWMWQLIPYVFALALPIMVVFLAEVLARGEEAEAKAYEREQRQQAKQTARNLPDDLSQNGTGLVRLGIESGMALARPAADAVRLVMEQMAQDVTAHRQICSNTGLGRGTVRQAIAQLVAQGALIKDAKGRASMPKNGTAVPESVPNSGSNAAESVPESEANQ